MSEIDQQPPEWLRTMEAEISELSKEVTHLRSQALVAGDDVIYRPPLWSQMSAYSAADDRRLVLSAFEPGVIDLSDLRVVPRQEGANLSVDVLPGHVVIRGTDQADQGNYLCPLSQRVNLPIPAGPAAGQHRRHYIYARVDEGDGTAEATWRVEAVGAPPGPLSDGPPFIPVHPSSSSMLAVITPIQTATVAITADLIYDFRHRARPASTGASILVKQTMPEIVPGPGSYRWGEIRVMVPPYGQAVDIELRLEGRMVTTGAGAIGLVTIAFSPTGESWDYLPDAMPVSSMNITDHTPFSRTLVVTNVTPTYPDQFTAEGRVGMFDWPAAAFAYGLLTMRITPSGSALSW